MKLGTVTKLDKRIKTTPKNNVISANCDVIAFFTIYDQLEPSGSQILEA